MFQTFKTLLHEVVTAKKLSGTKLQQLTEMGIALIKVCAVSDSE